MNINIPKKGDEFTEKELNRHFGVKNIGGSRPSIKNKLIVLVSSFHAKTHGNYKDRITDDFVYFEGGGAIGDQQMARTNKSIRDSKKQGRILLYFKKPEKDRLIFQFCVEYDSFTRETRIGQNGKPRSAIVFKLKIL